MDEKQLAYLEGLGYKYSDGAITDNKGNYVSSVAYGDGQIISAMPDYVYKEKTEYENRLKNKGFKEDYNSEIPRTSQIQQFEAFHKVKEFEKSPDKINLPKDGEEGSELVVEALQKRGEGKPSYTNVKDFEDTKQMQYTAETGDTTLEVLDRVAPENKAEYKDVQNRISEIMKEDPDQKTWHLNDLKKEEGDENFLEGLYRGGYNALTKVGAALSKDGKGMKNPELQKEYAALRKRRKGLIEPALTAQTNILKEERDSVLKELEGMDITEQYNFSQDSELLMRRRDILEKAITSSEASLEDESLFNPFNLDTGGRFTSFGLIPLYRSWDFNRIKGKLENDEELTDAEKSLVETQARVDELQGINYKKPFSYELVEGTVESTHFLQESMGGRRVAAKLLAKQLLKKGAAKILPKIAQIGTQTILHPQTYSKAFERHAGQITVTEGEDGNPVYETNTRTYKATKIAGENALKNNEELLREEKDPKKVKDLKLQRVEIQKSLDSLKEPMDMKNSLIYGASDVFKEVVIEDYARYLYKNPLTKKLFSNPLFDKLKSKQSNGLFKGGLDKLNKYLGGGSTIGGLGEETFEEVLAQAVPEYESNKLERAKQWEELTNPEFYAKVMGQTLLMRGALGGSTQAYSKLTEGKSLRDKKKFFNSLYKDLDNSGLSQEQFNTIFAKTGEGNLSVTEYNNAIQKEKDSGNIDAANEIERNKYFNMGKTAIRYGKGDKFIKSLDQAVKNTNLDGHTILAIQKAKEEVKDIQNTLNDLPSLRNMDEVLELKSKIRYNENNTEELKKEIDKISEKDLKIPEIKTKKESLETLIKDLETSNAKLNSALIKSTSYKVQKELQAEDNFIKTIDQALKTLKRQPKLQDIKTIRDTVGAQFKGKMKPENIEVILKQYEHNISVLDSSKKEKKVEETIKSVKKENAPKETIPEVKEKGGELKEDLPGERSYDDAADRFLASLVPLHINKQSPEKKVEEKDDDTNVDGSPKSNEPPAFSFLLASDGGEYNQEDLSESSDAIKEFSEAYKNINGTTPKFKNIIESFVDRVDGEAHLLKDHFESIGLAWEQAGLGESGWKNLYNTYYKNIDNAVDKAFGALKIKTKAETIGEATAKVVTEVQAVENTLSEKSKESSVLTDPVTGETVKATLNIGKTSTADHKLRYSAIEYEIQREEVDGKTITTYQNEAKPNLRKPDYVDIRDLVNPNKNNPGDKLSANLTESTDWDAVKITKRDKYGVPIGTELFSDWVTDNKKGFKSLEDFYASDKFISKVPIVYKDSQGNKVSFVPDVDSYNNFSTSDLSKEFGDEVDLKNPTPIQLDLIKEGKENLLGLRKSILNGDVESVRIEDNTSFKFITIPHKTKDGNVVPLPYLSEVAPGSTVVIANKDGTLLGLDSKVVSKENILGIESLIQFKGEKLPSGEVVPRFTNTGIPLYLSHTTELDGKKKYVAIKAMQYSEDSKPVARTQDMTTAKWISAAQEILALGDKSSVLQDKKHLYNLSVVEAKNIQRQVLDVTGYDIKNSKSYFQVLKSLVALRTETGKSFDPKQTTNALLSNSVSFGGNISISYKGKGVAAVKRNAEGSIQVDKIADSYEDYLKNTLSTNVMGYNVGTKENPIFTPAVQQNILVQPLIKDPTKLFKKKEETGVVKNREGEAPILGDTLSFLEDLKIEVADYLIEVNNQLAPDLSDTKSLESSSKMVEGFTIRQQLDIRDFTVSLIAKNSNKEEVQNKYNEFYVSRKNLISNHVKSLGLKIETIEDAETLNKANKILKGLSSEVFKIDTIIESFDKVFHEAADTASKFTKIEDEFTKDFSTIIEGKNYAKEGWEESPISKVGPIVKRVFAKVSNGDTGLYGVPRYSPFKTMFDSVMEIVAGDTHKSPSFNVMMDKLKLYQKSLPWVNPLIKELEDTDRQAKNQFVVNFYKEKVNPVFIAVTKKGKDIETKIFESNSNAPKRVLLEGWESNFNRIKSKSASYKRALSIWNNSATDPVKNQKDFKEFLDLFGINVSEKTWDAILKGQLAVKTIAGTQRTPYTTLFTNNKGHIFYSLKEFAKKELKDTKENSSPFSQMGSILDNLSKIENFYNPQNPSSTRYVGGKSITEYENPNYFYSQINKLKGSALKNGEYIKSMKSLSFSKNSLLLNLLEDKNFAEEFKHITIDNTALKDLHSNSSTPSGITDLNEVDHMLVKRGLFQDTKLSGKLEDYNGSPMRYAMMTTPTPSDKGRMHAIKTGVFDIYKNPELFFENETFSNSLNDLLYEQLVAPEVARALKHTETNYPAYDNAAKQIVLFPTLNDVANEEGVTVGDVLKTDITEEGFKKLFAPQVAKHIEQIIKDEVGHNLRVVGDSNINSVTYLGEKGDKTLAEYDFVINSMVTNQDMFKTLVGDPAQFHNSEKGDVNEIEALNLNLGKRLALLIAPGSTLAESRGEKYYQVFLKDASVVAENIKDILSYKYGNKALEETIEGVKVKDVISNFGESSPEVKNEIYKRFPAIKDFLNIESTDAQELTTDREHINLLFKEGKLSEEDHIRLTDKITKRRAKEKRGDKLLESDKLSSTDIDLILQPVKPVYSGTHIDLEQDLNRVVYIKSSSYPLLSEVTKGSKLDALRVKLEQLEDTLGGKSVDGSPSMTGVRASYNSANKVGALRESIDPFDDSSLDNLNSVDGLGKYYLELDRSNLKIQQQIPYKSKDKKDDGVSMSTQIHKLLFGNNVNKLEGFIYKGEKLDGSALQSAYNKTFSNIIDHKKNNLLRRMGVSNDLTIQNKKEASEKLQNYLQKKAKELGYGKQDIKSLELQPNTNGDYHFKLPLWLTGNSDKFESLLTSVVSNTFFKHKLPGYSFVTTSGEGMQIQENFEGIDQNSVIHIGGYKGGTLKGGGKDNVSEILISSKFKMNGVLVDLFEDFKGDDGKYIERVDGVLKLKSDMISPEILESFSYRIPASSHKLGSNVKVVGFLPEISGDRIVAPNNFITQMGQDFDIDKLQLYMYHHLVYPNGKIEKLTSKNRNEYLDLKRAELEDLKWQIKSEKSFGGEATKFFEDNFNVDLTGEFSIDKLESKVEEVKKELEENFYLKIQENNFIEITQSVYSHKGVKKLVNRALSMDYTMGQAKAIATLSVDTNNSNVLTPSYQRGKSIKGSTGNTAIEIYARTGTFNSLVQQAGGLDINVPKYIVGDMKVSGNLGGFKEVVTKTTTEEQSYYSGVDIEGFKKSLLKDTSEIIDEKINTGTDNEKAQVLGRVGLEDKKKISVDSFFLLQGIESEYKVIPLEEYDVNNMFHKKTMYDGGEIAYTEYSIPYLLHSQPIIKEYYKRLANAEGKFSDYNPEYRNKVQNELLKEFSSPEYSINGGTLYKGKIPSSQNEKFTGEILSEQVLLDGNDKLLQAHILTFYINAEAKGNKIQNIVNAVEMKTLGRSSWSALQKSIDKIKVEIGEIDISKLLKSTPQGSAINSALDVWDSLFSSVFPSQDTDLNSKLEDIIFDIYGDDVSSNKKVKEKETLFKEVKRFITSGPHIGVTNGDIVEARKTLLRDSKENTSLSSYVANTIQSQEETKGLKFLRENNLINSLKFRTKGGFGTISYNNVESVEEDFLVESFKDLILQDLPLPDKNGQAYSTRMLAQELIAYSFLSGGVVKGGKEFHTLIPIEYFEDLKIVDDTGKELPMIKVLQHYDSKNSSWGAVLPNGSRRLDNFEKQYYQHFPEKVSFDNTVKEINNGLYVADTNKNYISVKQKGGEFKRDKWDIFENVGENLYKKIHVLGEGSVTEYNYTEQDAKSMFNDNVQLEKFGSQAYESNIRISEQSVVSEYKDTTAKGFLEDIAYGEFEGMSNFLQKAVGNLPVKFINNKQEAYAGRRIHSEESGERVLLNLAYLKNNDEVSRTGIHEITHTVTVKEIEKYSNSDGTLKDSAPKELQGLNFVYKEYRKAVQKDTDYQSFLTDYNNKSETNTFKKEEIEIFYPSVSLTEFVAASFERSPNFLKRASGIPYKKSDLDIYTKFKVYIKDMLERLGGNSKESNIAIEAYIQTLNYVESINSAKTTKPSYKVKEEVTGSKLKALLDKYNNLGNDILAPIIIEKAVSTTIENIPKDC